VHSHIHTTTLSGHGISQHRLSPLILPVITIMFRLSQSPTLLVVCLELSVVSQRQNVEILTPPQPSCLSMLYYYIGIGNPLIPKIQEDPLGAHTLSSHISLVRTPMRHCEAFASRLKLPTPTYGDPV